MSQVQLSAACGINQGALSRIETGGNIPSGPVIFALSKALSAPSDAILAPSELERDEILRSRGRMPFRMTLDGSSVPPETEETAKELMAAFLTLEDICGARKIPRVPANMFFGHSEEGIVRTVSALRAYMQVQSGVLFDYFELLEIFGLRVLVLPLSDGVDGFSYYDPPHRNAFLFVNADMNPERQLFRLCYELGHVGLLASPAATKPTGEDGFSGDDLGSARAARRFAGLFLLPADAVRATVQQLGIGERQWGYDLLLRIKRHFSVSAEMFLHRLNELGLIAPDLVEPLKARIYEHYEATDFAEPDSTRRLLTPNRRLWDLVITAQGFPEYAEEVERIAEALEGKKVARG